MPSFPNLPVLFPDEAVFLNQRGFRPPMETILPPHLQFFTNPEDPAEIVKKGWDAQSRKVVMDSLANNKSKELGMLGRKGNTPNSTLTGGAVTKAGRSMARQFLMTRAENKASTSESSFFSPTAQVRGTEVAPPDTRTLYITLVSIADEIQVGNITEGTLSKLNSAIGSLLQISPNLSGKQMGQIRDFLTTMAQSCRVLLTRQQLDASKRRLTASALSQLERMSGIITQMAQTSSPREREIIGRQMFTSLGVEPLESALSPLFRERQVPNRPLFEPPLVAPSGRPRGRPTLEEQAQVAPPGQSSLLDWLKRGEARSTATGSTGNPLAPFGLLSPTSAAVEEALASAGSPSGTTRKLRLPPTPSPSGEGRYGRRGRKY